MFPCGAVKVDDKIIMTYDAGDYVVRIGVVDVLEFSRGI